jgi:hypothetical protein
MAAGASRRGQIHDAAGMDRLHPIEAFASALIQPGASQSRRLSQRGPREPALADIVNFGGDAFARRGPVSDPLGRAP